MISRRLNYVSLAICVASLSACSDGNEGESETTTVLAPSPSSGAGEQPAQGEVPITTPGLDAPVGASEPSSAAAFADATELDTGLVGTETGDAESLPVASDIALPSVDSGEGKQVAYAVASASYPCDGSTASYKVVVSKSGSTWTARRGNATLYSGTSLSSALSAAFNGLTANRTSKEAILVSGSGDYPATTRINIPSYTVLNVCGTINVTGSASGDYAPIYARGRRDIDVPNAKITGSPPYAMFFRDVDNLHLGQLDIRTKTGIGVRIDNNNSSVYRKNISIDYVYGEGMASHAVETLGLDGVTIGTVSAKNTGECGLLLNRSVNTKVDLVTCDNCGAGTGYAAFRIANDAGKIGSDWPAGNIRVKKVYARRGGRGIFSVSGSGGLTIDQIDLGSTGAHAILLQNAVNVTIAGTSSTVNGGAILLSNDTTNTNNGKFIPSRNVLLQNLKLSGGSSVSEAWCDLGDRGNRAKNITGGAVKMCF